MIPFRSMPLLTMERCFCCVYRSRDSRCFSVGRTTPKIAPSRGDMDPHLIQSSLGPPESIHPNRISIGSAVLQGSQTWLTDRQTDRPHFCVCRNRPHLAIAAVRPKNHTQPNIYWPIPWAIDLVDDGGRMQINNTPNPSDLAASEPFSIFTPD